MKRKFYIILAISLLIFNNQTLFASTLPPNAKELINDTCFEVIVNKPERDTLKYEKELPWHLLPYHIRVDKYFSIGTAFAISAKELLTAFHVLDLKNNSLVFTDYYIRDSKGNVYEVDTITAFDSHRDFVKFTVKGKKFEKFLPLQTNFVTNEIVHAVGNAYGEGIVIRQGELIGTYPEPEDGKFVLIKSSSDVNFGNSGGPLLNNKGEVIGLVIQRKDNIAYSLPISEIMKVGSRGLFHVRMIFGFNLLPEKNLVSDFDYEIQLPQHYKKIKIEYAKAFYSYYIEKMKTLLQKETPSLFPEGEASLLPLFDFSDSYQPQVVYLNKTNDKWTISEMEYQHTKIRNNGAVRIATAFDKTVFIDITRPENMTLKEMLDDPKTCMKLFLEGIRLTRDFGEVKVRIVEFGEPLKVEFHTDKYLRKWRICTWLLEYSDEAFITCETPTPEGMAVVGFSCQSSEIDLWKFDAHNVIDLVQLSYFGSVKNWREFLKNNPLLPSVLKDTVLHYVPKKQFEFRNGNIKLKLKNDIIPISDELRMGINFGFIKEKDEVKWTLRRIIVNEPQRDNYFSLVSWPAPDQRLPKDAQMFWNGMIKKQHPYTEKPFHSNNITKIATVLKTFYSANGNKVEKMYALFMGKEGKEDDRTIINRFKKLKNSITIVR